MRFFRIVLVASMLVGSAAATTNHSGLRGPSMRGPISPVCAAERPCSAPAKALTLVFRSNGRTVGRTQTDNHGWYRVALRPGYYTVGTTSTNTFGTGSNLHAPEWPPVIGVSTSRSTPASVSTATRATRQTISSTRYGRLPERTLSRRSLARAARCVFRTRARTVLTSLRSQRSPGYASNGAVTHARSSSCPA